MRFDDVLSLLGRGEEGKEEEDGVAELERNGGFRCWEAICATALNTAWWRGWLSVWHVSVLMVRTVGELWGVINTATGF